MVIQKAVDNLKDKSHEEKTAVASGVAISVVVILMIGWGFLFLRKIQRGDTIPTLNSGAVPSDQVDQELLNNAQSQINQMYQNSADQYRQIRENAAQNQAGTNAQYTQPSDTTGGNEFGGE